MRTLGMLTTALTAAVLAAILAVLVASAPDIRRYLKIRSM